MRTRFTSSSKKMVCPHCGETLGVFLIYTKNRDRKPRPLATTPFKGVGSSPNPGDMKGGKFLSLFPPEFVENSMFCETWSDFEQFRKDKKKALTKLGVKRIVNRIKEKDVETVILMINQSIENSWTGIFDAQDEDPDSGRRHSREENLEFYGEDDE